MSWRRVTFGRWACPSFLVEFLAPLRCVKLSLDRYEKEKRATLQFVEGLSSVRRLLAHIPTAMIFDDHDVTDDWNLNRAWEALAYSGPPIEIFNQLSPKVLPTRTHPIAYDLQCWRRRRGPCQENEIAFLKIAKHG